MSSAQGQAYQQVLQAIRQTVGVGTPAPPAEDVVDYPWHEPQRFTRGQLDAVKDYCDRAAEAVRLSVVELLNDEYTECSATFSQRFAPDVVGEWAQNTDFLIPIADASRQFAGAISLPIDRGLVWVQALLGAIDPEASQEDQKELSPLEEGLLEDVAGVLLGALITAAQTPEAVLTPLGGVHHEVYSPPENAPSDYAVIAIELARDGQKVPVTITVSADALLPVCGGSGGGEKNDGQDDQGADEAKSRMRWYAGLATVVVTAELGSAQVTMRDIMTLEEGDVLLLDRKMDAPADLRLRDAVVSGGHPVQCGEHFGFRLCRGIGSPPDEEPS